MIARVSARWRSRGDGQGHISGQRQRQASDEGQATVEFALILPFFVLLIVALLDVTSIVRDQLLVDTIAREAARTASMASNRTAAEEMVNDVVVRSGRNDATRQLRFDDGLITVTVSIEPRLSMTGATLRWLGTTRRVISSATFATEYDIDEQ